PYLPSFRTKLFQNNTIAGPTLRQEIRLPKTRFLPGFQIPNKSKTSIFSLALPNSTTNPSTYHSPATRGNISTIERYTSTALKHLKKTIQHLRVKATPRTTLPGSTSYSEPWKKQSLPLQINLPAYREPHAYKKVC